MLASLLELLFPSSCLGCQGQPVVEPGLMICRDCRELLDPLTSPLCSRCGISFPRSVGGDHLCGSCLTDNCHFDLARALVSYRPPVPAIISGFKYQGRTGALRVFRSFFEAHPCREELGSFQSIIPVPLHVSRLRWRGFNQALLLARTFFPDQKRLIAHSALERVRNTASQTGMSGMERRKNLKNAFLVRDEKAVSGKEVLLVDDVFTTGTTVSECARILKKAGAERVVVLTVARADR